MAIYTVHEPPLKAGENEPDPDRFVFVRDGFYLWAFLLTPLWMLRYRLWLVLVCYVLIGGALNVVLYLVRATPAVTVAVSVLLALLVGLEAGTLRRWTLARRGFRAVGLVVGDDVESAERRFFDGWVKGEHPVSAPPASAASAISQAPIIQRPPAGSEVLGLFPQPGAPR